MTPSDGATERTDPPDERSLSDLQTPNRDVREIDEQIVNTDVECACQTNDHSKPRRLQASLHLSHEVRAQPGRFGKRFLGQPSLVPHPAQRDAEQLSDRLHRCIPR